MSKRLVFLTSLVALLLLSGCNLPITTTVEPTPTLFVLPSALPYVEDTPAPTATEIVVPTSEPTDTPLPPTPTACNYSSDFVQDITIPDGTVITAGQDFTKSWELLNDGCLPWQGLSLYFSSGNRMLGPTSGVRVEDTDSNKTVVISINLRAPDEPGSYVGYWHLVDNFGTVIETVYVYIVVPEPTATATPTLTPTLTPTPVTDFAFVEENGNPEAGTFYCADDGLTYFYVLVYNSGTLDLESSYLSLTDTTVDPDNLLNASQSNNPFNNGHRCDNLTTYDLLQDGAEAYLFLVVNPADLVPGNTLEVRARLYTQDNQTGVSVEKTINYVIPNP